MDSKSNSRAGRVGGERNRASLLSLRTEHCVNVERCAPEELAHMVLSQRDCRMRLILVNRLAVEEQVEKPICTTERGGLFAPRSRLWK